MDFEAAVWGALKCKLPAATRKGCAFHWTQAVWRKVQEVGLQQTYMSDRPPSIYLRKLMALPLLPPEFITHIFSQLQAEATTEPLKELCTYVDSTWMKSEVWLPSAWSVYMESIRTNNDVEGWHTRLNSNHKDHMALYRLVLILKAEADFVPTALRLVSEHKLQRYQRKKYREVQGMLFDAW